MYSASRGLVLDALAYGSHSETENNIVALRHHSGTSASTPIFASMVPGTASLWNSYLAVGLDGTPLLNGMLSRALTLEYLEDWRAF